MPRLPALAALAAVVVSLFVSSAAARSSLTAEEEITQHVEQRIALHLKRIKQELGVRR